MNARARSIERRLMLSMLLAGSAGTCSPATGSRPGNGGSTHPEAGDDAGTNRAPDAGSDPDSDSDSDAVDAGDGCPQDWIRCGADCVDPEWDSSHCGGCDVRCEPPTSDRCWQGSCRCGIGDGSVACAGSPADACCAGDGVGASCVDTTSNRSHCGECGNACPAATACVAARCEPCECVSNIDCGVVACEGGGVAVCVGAAAGSCGSCVCP